MADETLIAAIERHERLAERGGVADERALALDYYHGKPLGNEVEGESQVVSRDVFDTVEWIKPQIADIFCGGDEVINFSPRGPEDVQAAEQETEYVNHIITQKNEWFQIWYDWSHDALLQKVGYVKAYWDESEDRTKEKYANLTSDELQLLLEDQGMKPVEYSANPDGTHTVTLEHLKKYGCVKLANVAPENVLIDHNARGLSLQDHRVAFAEHREWKTITELRDEGFAVEDDIQDAGNSSQDWEENQRDENNPFLNSDEESDPSMRRVKVRECWIRFDDNGDGLAELLHVFIVGTTILGKPEEADFISLYALCPTPTPHQHHGLSLADAVMDLQRIKTALLRGGLNNQYLANNGRHAVDANNVNLDDLLTSRPGGIVRVDGPPGLSIAPLTHTVTGDMAITMLDYVDRVKTQRTGVNEQAQGLDSNTINKNTPYATTAALMSAAQMRIRFIARIFAETGVKGLFGGVHALSLKHSRQADIVRLRNKWVPVDPRQWQKRQDMQISVGLGAGDKVQQLAFLEKVLQIQGIAVQQGLATLPQVFNTLKRLTQAAGFKDPNEFWTDPAQAPQQPKGPPPEVQAEMAKGQVAVQTEQIKGQVTMAVEKERSALKLQELRANLELQASNDQRDAQREQMRAYMDAQLAAQQQQLDKYKADLDNEVKMAIAELNAATKPSPQYLAIQAELDRQHDVELARIAQVGRSNGESHS